LRPEDRTFLLPLLVPLARATLRQLRLLVSVDTMLSWHRDLIRHRHARANMEAQTRPAAHSRLGPRLACVWRVRTSVGVIGASTINWPCSASRSPRPPRGRF
jgi:hypothetical protein